MKYCINCKFYSKKWYQLDAFCCHPSALDPVDSKIHSTCYRERMWYSNCQEFGHLFEPKESEGKKDL